MTAVAVAAFITAFAGSVALWWIYFDRSAEDGARVIAESPDPGRLANSAYHLIHPVVVAGIIDHRGIVVFGPNEVGSSADLMRWPPQRPQRSTWSRLPGL